MKESIGDFSKETSVEITFPACVSNQKYPNDIRQYHAANLLHNIQQIYILHKYTLYNA